jgi:hypothetical protein
VNACESGKLSQEQALIDINKKYKHTLKHIKQKKTAIIKKHGFFEVVLVGIDGLISIHDRTINQSFEPELENYLNIYNKIIKDFISKKISDKTQKMDFDLAMVTINKERSEIAEICREERIITEAYEKAVVDIANIQKTFERLQEPELVPNEKMPPRFQKMLSSKVITGEKINSRWVVNNDKHGIKELMKWSEENNEVFTADYIIRTFCKRDGKPFTRGSINTYRSKYGLTGNDDL